MTVLGIDPGTYESAWCILVSGVPVDFAKMENDQLRLWLAGASEFPKSDTLVIEEMQSYGMPAGREMFETCFWSGRFVEAWGGNFVKLPRKEVVGHLCNSGRAKDANVRQAIIDRFGGKAAAIGTKKSPGPLYGMSKDCWSACAIALTHYDRTREGKC